MSQTSSNKVNPLNMTKNDPSEQSLLSALQDTLSLQGELLQKAQQSANDKVGRECARQILEEIGSFLVSWEALSVAAVALQEDSEEDFPGGVVRDGLFMLLSEMGPDTQIRTFLLETLPELQRISTRQVLLDVLPFSMPTALDDDVEDATRQVIDVMRQITLHDTDALLPVLDCLSKLDLSKDGSLEAWNLALSLLPVVSEHDLPILVQTLLRHMTSENDALRALEALRVELQLIEASRNSGQDDEIAPDKDGDPILLVADVLLNAIQDEGRKDIAKAYLQILQRLATNEASEEEKSESLSNNGFLVLDIIAMLSLYGNEEFKRDTETLFDTLLQHGRFPFESLKLLLKSWGTSQKANKSSSFLYEQSILPLLSLAIWMLLVPVRSSSALDVERILTDTQGFITELYHALDKERQEELVHCLLHFGDDSLLALPGSSKQLCSHSSRQNGMSRKYDKFGLSLEAVHRILQSLAVSCRGTLTKFKHVLISRLTSLDNHIDSNDASTQHVCHILASLVEPVYSTSWNGTGIDSSELMLLLQKLLFTSSHRQHHYLTEMQEIDTDTGRVIRGLNLATELVRSPSVGHGDKECIQQWVLRVLLPSTRRSVDADVGLCGLQFFTVWSEWYQTEFPNRQPDNPNANHSGADTFQHIKMILANTGLVQMLSHYQQRKKSSTKTILGYTTVHKHFATVIIDGNASSQIPKRRKKRDMVFCTTSFLRNVGMPHSSRWGQCIRWIYQLVDTYLKMGQEASSKTKSKWIPDGWLEAAIELPDLQLESTKANKQTEGCEDDWIHSRFKLFEVDLGIPSTLGAGTHDLSSLLLPGTSVEDYRLHVENGYRLALTLILSISTSFAVLRNAHDHYAMLKTSNGVKVNVTRESAGGANVDIRQRELFGLIRYQVVKIHDMRNKCEECLELLESYKSFIKKNTKMKTKKAPERRQRAKVLGVQRARGVDDENDAMKRDSELDMRKGKQLLREIDLVMIRVRKLLLILFTSTEFIDPCALGDCLLDADENDFLQYLSQIADCEFVDSTALAASKITDIHHEINIRRSLIEHIATMTRAREDVRSNAVTDTSLASLCRGEIADVTKNKRLDRESLFGHCVRMVERLLPLLPSLRKIAARMESSSEIENTTCNGLSDLVYAYTSMIQLLFSKSLKGKSGQPLSTEKTSQFMLYIHECTKSLNRDIVSFRNAPNDAVLSDVFEGFLEHLRQCENSRIAMQLQDILSILALQGKQTLIKTALQASWKCLHTIYVSEVPIIGNTTLLPLFASISQQGLPSVFRLVVGELMLESQHVSNFAKKSTKFDNVFAATLVKSANCRTKDFEEHNVLRNNLLVHWALMAKSSCFDDLTELIDFLEYFIGEFEKKSLHKTRAQKQNLKEEKDSHLSVSQIPSLTVASLPVYFELILHMVIATLTVWEPSRRRQKKSPPKTSKDGSGQNSTTRKAASPYEDFEDTCRAFCRLVGLYMSKFQLFPKRMASIVFAACSQIMNVTTLQLHRCVEWRNVQPLLSLQEKKAGVHDYASIQYLQLLLNAIGPSCPGTVLSLCAFVRSQASAGARKGKNSSAQEDDDMHSLGLDGETLVFASHHKKIIALALASEGVIVTLKEIATAHNLTAPAVRGTGQKQELRESVDTRKRKVKERDRGFHEVVTGKESAKREFHPKRRLIPKLVTKNTRVVDSDTSGDEQNSIVHNEMARKKHPVIEEENDDDHEHQWMDDSDASSTEEPEDDGSKSVSSTASFGVLGDWDPSDENSTGSLELEAQDLFGRSTTGNEQPF